MMKEAESHAEDDKKRKEEIETRNHADQAVYQAEHLLRDSGEKLSGPDRAGIEAAINDLKSAMEKNETAAIKSRMDALTQVQHKAAEAMYRSASASGGQGAGPSGQPGGAESGQPRSDASQGDVIDAEVVEEEKK